MQNWADFQIWSRIGRLLPHSVKLVSSLQRVSQKKVMSVLWREWQVWGIITGTWKVCVSTFGHLRRIDPHCAAAGLMSTGSPASNEQRAIATIFHQPSAPSLQHPVMAWTHSVRNWTVVDILSYINAGPTDLAKESARMSSMQSQSRNTVAVSLFWLTWYLIHTSAQSAASCDSMLGQIARKKNKGCLWK